MPSAPQIAFGCAAMPPNRRSDSRFELLITPGFIAALALLLTNDFYLKTQFGNWFTGKLSDAAGLVAAALFLTAFAPRWRTLMHAAVGIVFVLWKSPLADGVITHWNQLDLVTVDRVLDYTDWVAVLALPASWFYSVVARGVPQFVPLKPIIAVVACVAFVATSEANRTTREGQQFEIGLPRATVVAVTDSLDDADSTFFVSADTNAVADTLYFYLPSRARAEVELRGTSDRTTLTILTVSTPRSVLTPADSIRRMLVRSVVGPLRARAANRAPSG